MIPRLSTRTSYINGIRVVCGHVMTEQLAFPDKYLLGGNDAYQPDFFGSCVVIVQAGYTPQGFGF